MRRKTIGEVIRMARVNQGLSLKDLQESTGIQVEFLEALESDNFNKLSNSLYVRSFLRKYALAVDLDEKIILSAYKSGSMIAYDEVEEDETRSGYRSRRNQEKMLYLPLFYFSLAVISILFFVTYYIHVYVKIHQENSSPNHSSARISRNSQMSVSELKEEPSSLLSDSDSNYFIVSNDGDDKLIIKLPVSEGPIQLKLSVTDITSWISVTGTDLESGVILSPSNSSVSTTLTDISSTVITLGVVQGVEVMVNDQRIDTSNLISQTGIITFSN